MADRGLFKHGGKESLAGFFCSIDHSRTFSWDPHSGQPIVGNVLFRKFIHSFVLIAAIIAVSGCEKSPPPNFRFNSVEWLRQQGTPGSGDKFDESYKTEIGSVVTALFGTPDEPRFPYFLGDEDPAHEIINLDNLKMAAGAVKSDKVGDPRGLYREHCAHCHGVTGDGAGPTAELLNPYPRDFRLAKFKFKSTELGQRPTDHDLHEVMVNGIPGTAMPSFRTLPEKEIEALIQYVKYLSIRGQYERYLIGEVGGLDDGMALIDTTLIMDPKEGEASEDDREEFEERIYELIGDPLQESIISKWLNPDRKVAKIPDAPAMFDLDHPSHDQFVAEGRDLFFTKGNCAQCHGETGYGDGEATNFDAWTKEWINSASDPTDPSTYAHFLEAGALPPRPILPRNLHLPVYRGGDHPDDIYLRIANGIEGTPMPASSALTSDEKWKIVAYVRSLPYENPGLKEKLPVNDKEIPQ